MHLEIINLSKRFKDQDKPALDNINAVIQPGVITGIVGPDGAGKTTLIRLMTGLMKPTSGSILINGENLEKVDLSSSLGYMPQKFGFYEDLTVLENLTLYVRLRGVEPDEVDATYERMLQFTNLKRFVTQLLFHSARESTHTSIYKSF